ncbi:MAG TPA: exodeoxyribonuclease VII large subunit, partial [Tepidisphaeraceae bacterium]
DALSALSRRAASVGGIDVIILARGGGSLEDLWEFNEEVVARAIVASKIPIVTGIGHEVDVSIADLAADHHAHTPTEAAQVITAQWRTAKADLDGLAIRVVRELRQAFRQARQNLLAIQRHDFFRRPTDGINRLRQWLDDRQRSLALMMMRRVRLAQQRLAPSEALLIRCHPFHEIRRRRERVAWLQQELVRSTQATLARSRLKLDAAERTLVALSPEHVLRRGYSITMLKRGGAIVQSKSSVSPGDVLVTRLPDGSIESVVRDDRQGQLFERED